MLPTWLALSALIAAGPAAPTEKRYSSLSTEDLNELALVLRQRVATIELDIKPQPGLLVDPIRIVFGIVIDDKTIATVAQLCTDAAKAQVQGPKGSLPARVALLDLERRVALLRTDGSLQSIGLRASTPLTKSERQLDAEVFALTNTGEGAGVMDGVIMQVGELPEYEGHPRTSLSLTFGMPVFDAYTRWVGFARTVAWDKDTQMLVPPDKVRLARSSTVTRVAVPEKPKRPWWAR